jgi:hypothetical protein
MAKRYLHDHVVGSGESCEVSALLVNPVTNERLRFTRTPFFEIFMGLACEGRHWPR